MLFNLGQTFTTPRILEDLKESYVASLLLRHKSNDWGDLGTEDKQANDDAIKYNNDRVLSAYSTPSGRVYVITEADRSRTTVLYADEY